MSSAFSADFDYSQYDPDKVQEQMESGGIVPAGYYRAYLNGAETTTAKESGRLGWKLTFKIIGGPHDGQEVTDTLWDGDKGPSINRVLMFKHRLGLIGKNPETGKYAPIEGKVDFRDCLDTKVIIFVKNEEYERAKDGQKGISVKLEFNGIFFENDPKAIEKLGQVGQGGSSGEPGTGAGTTAPKTPTAPASRTNSAASTAAATKRAAIADL